MQIYYVIVRCEWEKKSYVWLERRKKKRVEKNEELNLNEVEP